MGGGSTRGLASGGSTGAVWRAPLTAFPLRSLVPAPPLRPGPLLRSPARAGERWRDAPPTEAGGGSLSGAMRLRASKCNPSGAGRRSIAPQPKRSGSKTSLASGRTLSCLGGEIEKLGAASRGAISAVGRDGQDR